MIRKIRLPLKETPYEILIGSNVLARLGGYLRPLKIGKDAVIITHPALQRLYGKTLVAGLKKSGFTVKVIEVPEGEPTKSIQRAFQVLEKVAHYDCLKEVFIVALGGGVIGDLAGFVAAIYKRGVPYIQVPTTFLAQIDSSIGGKVAVDLPLGKNLVGAFHQPRMVLSDVAVLSTLDERQIRNGLAEAVKYGVIYDKRLFQYLCNNYRFVLERNPRALVNVVLNCSRIKAEVIAADEKETKGIRTILNFGHTIGHAIEAADAYSGYQHGEAVGLGMRIAAEISFQLGMLSRQRVLEINQLLTDIGLPEKIKRVCLADILRVMKHDKKFISGTNRFVLASDIGRVKIIENVPLDVIKKAVKNSLAA